ncbi:Radical SAM superfamily protein [uncultured archaeon]|nr:Radical SAM superfamily protein [uncultured archaeon]
MVKQNSLLEYLEVFTSNPQVSYKIASQFDFDRLFVLAANMGFRTFVSSRRKRADFEKRFGFKVPTRTSLDIGDYCNLHCKTCYVNRSNEVLAEDVLEKIVSEGLEIGIHAMPIFGGEPFHPRTRNTLFSSAQRHPNVEYLVCTNGTFVSQPDVIGGIRECKNIFPYVSLDGLREKNDFNRGKGVFDMVSEAMEVFKRERIFYGVSSVVTNENIEELSSDSFFSFLDSKNARVLYVRKCLASSEGSQINVDSGQETAFFSNLAIMAKRYGVHTLGGEVRNPTRQELGLREHHLLHFKTNGVARYGRFGPEVGDITAQHLTDIFNSERMRGAVAQNFARLYQN